MTMARASASDQLTRLLALPAWVADNPGVSIKEAAEHFGVPPAVIERDVNTLWVSGLPGGMHGDLVDFDASDFEAGRLRLCEPLGLDRPVRLTRQEAISLLMALRVLADLLADDEASAPVIASTQQAVTALLSSSASSEDSDARADPETVTTTGPGPAHAGRSSRTSRILAVVRSALQDRRRLHLVYVSATDTPSERDVDPITLESDGSHMTLVGWCLSAQAERSFRLDRITSAEALDTPAVRHRSSRRRNQPITMRATNLVPRWFSNRRAVGSPSRSRASPRRRPGTATFRWSLRDAIAPGSSAWSSRRVAISWQWSPRTSLKRRQQQPNRH